jgi:hypothetical protein
MAFVMVGKIGKSWKMGQTDSVHIAMLASVSCDIYVREVGCMCTRAGVVSRPLLYMIFPFLPPISRSGTCSSSTSLAQWIRRSATALLYKGARFSNHLVFHAS